MTGVGECCRNYFVLDQGSNVDYYVEVLPKSNVNLFKNGCVES